jgi:hypothetical protein
MNLPENTFKGAINLAYHVSDDISFYKRVSHKAALDNLELAYLELKRNDFAVIDTIVDNKVYDKIVKILLTSTIYYDVTNGKVFVSYPKDGLVFKILQDFSQVFILFNSSSNTFFLFFFFLFLNLILGNS